MSDPGQISILWGRAISQYATITKKKLEDPAMLSLTTVSDLLHVIEDENKNFTSFREKAPQLRRIVKHAMTPLELVGTIISDASSQAFPPSALVFSGVKLLIEAAKGASEKYDAIIEIMSALKDFTVRLEVYSEQHISERLCEKLTEILTTLIEVLAFARQEVKHGRLLSYGKSILSGSEGGREAMARFTKLVQSESSLVNSETLTQVKGATMTLARVDSNINKISQRLEDVRLGDLSREEDDVTTRLNRILQPSTSSEDRFQSLNRSRVPQTGDWIRDEKAFVAWINREKPILWIAGNPGAGKSYIASNIVNHLQHERNIPVGFFFFKEDDAVSRSAHQALRDVAFQLASNDPFYAKHVEACVKSLQEIPTLSSLWRKLFVNFFIDSNSKARNEDSRAYVILDALDEAFLHDRHELFQLAKDIKVGQSIQLLMLGRPQIAEEMNDLMETLEVPTIDVTEENNFKDIVHFIKSGIARSVYLRKLAKPVQREIVQKLATGAQGMFMWASLILQELSRVRNKGDIQKTLNGAPRGLSRMIQRVLEGFSESLKGDPQFSDDPFVRNELGIL